MVGTAGRCSRWSGSPGAPAAAPRLVLSGVLEHPPLRLPHRAQHHRLALLHKKRGADEAHERGTRVGAGGQRRRSRSGLERTLQVGVCSCARTSSRYAPTPRFIFWGLLSALKASLMPRMASGGACKRQPAGGRRRRAVKT